MTRAAPTETDLLVETPAASSGYGLSLLAIAKAAGMRDGDAGTFRLARVALHALIGKGLVQRRAVGEYQRTEAGDRLVETMR